MKEYRKRIQWENRLLWAGIVLLAVFIVVGGEFWNELGFLHSYQMTDRAGRCKVSCCSGFSSISSSAGDEQEKAEKPLPRAISE